MSEQRRQPSAGSTLASRRNGNFVLAIHVVLGVLGAEGCVRAPEAEVASPDPAPTRAEPPRSASADFPLADLRASFRTRYVGEGDDYPPDPPPPGVFDLIHYAAPLGRNAAYVTPPAPAGTSARKPAIIWVSGGFNWGIDRGAWTPEPRANDQSATTFLHAGIVLMRPSLRGRNGNPGQPECFVGEVDDIIAAGEYLRTRADVDPNRIYLGGHSTGGTLALLTAASTDRFRAIFAFGAAHDARGYEVPECIPSEDESDEALVRAPIMWLTSIRTPTFVIEGVQRGWTDVYPMMEAEAGSAPIRFLAIPESDHFSVIAPASEVVRDAILADTGPSPVLDITVERIVAGLRP
ncbi:MAG: prolyl oligopeptidase family serine peptidase [Sandaracinaceae bacterium]|nr:prolyl oligopeptidase family serine peptidase [Sandaracinaceae bacterium]